MFKCVILSFIFIWFFCIITLVYGGVTLELVAVVYALGCHVFVFSLPVFKPLVWRFPLGFVDYWLVWGFSCVFYVVCV